MCDACGLGTSKKPERVSTQRSLFLIFSLVFHGRRGGTGRGGVVTELLFLFLVFPGLQGTVQTTIIIIILIIIIVIIVTCIHSIFVERQQEQVPPTYYNKGPDSTDSQ